MTPNPTEFNRGVISPMECIKEGWALIKDQYWLFFGITLVGMLIGGAVPVAVCRRGGVAPRSFGSALPRRLSERSERHVHETAALDQPCRTDRLLGLRRRTEQACQRSHHGGPIEQTNL